MKSKKENYNYCVKRYKVDIIKIKVSIFLPSTQFHLVWAITSKQINWLKTQNNKELTNNYIKNINSVYRIVHLF